VSWCAVRNIGLAALVLVTLGYEDGSVRDACQIFQLRVGLWKETFYSGVLNGYSGAVCERLGFEQWRHWEADVGCDSLGLGLLPG